MTKRILQTIGLTLCLSILPFLGCSKDAGPPPPLAAEQIPSEFDKAFKAAKQETKDLAASVSTSLQAKDYPAAYAAVQALCSAPDETSGQRALAVRAMLSIQALLRDAQAQGDDKAAAALNYYRMTK